MRKDLDAVHKTLAHGAPLDRWGNPDWPRSGYGRDSEEYRDFFQWFQERSPDQVKVLQRELKTLRTDQESAGGYLVPEVMDDQIKKNILEISPVRAHARLRIALPESDDHPAPPIGADCASTRARPRRAPRISRSTAPSRSPATARPSPCRRPWT